MKAFETESKRLMITGLISVIFFYLPIIDEYVFNGWMSWNLPEFLIILSFGIYSAGKLLFTGTPKAFIFSSVASFGSWWALYKVGMLFNPLDSRD